MGLEVIKSSKWFLRYHFFDFDKLNSTQKFIWIIRQQNPSIRKILRNTSFAKFPLNVSKNKRPSTTHIKKAMIESLILVKLLKTVLLFWIGSIFFFALCSRFLIILVRTCSKIFEFLSHCATWKQFAWVER